MSKERSRQAIRKGVVHLVVRVRDPQNLPRIVLAVVHEAADTVPSAGFGIEACVAVVAIAGARVLALHAAGHEVGDLGPLSVFIFNSLLTPAAEEKVDATNDGAQCDNTNDYTNSDSDGVAATAVG